MPVALEERIKILIFRYIAGSLTKEEDKELGELIRHYPEIKELIRRMLDKKQVAKDIQLLRSIDARKAYSKVKAEMCTEKITSLSDRRQTVLISWKRITIAASLIVLMGSSYLFFTKRIGKSDKTFLLASLEDASPGGEKAVLTLINEELIQLDTMQTGRIIHQTGASFWKESSGRIVYMPSSTSMQEHPQELNEGRNDINNTINYNILTTPRSGQFAVSLPDGTKVWMNNESSLKYPTVFRGKNREVSLTGEAHFEVTENVDQPFRVKVNDLDVDVLGTSFAIQAYRDETQVSTTLLTGKVRLNEGTNTQTITAGERMIITKGKTWKLEKQANTEAATAWEKGKFNFSRASLETVLKQLCRWYNVGYEIGKNVPEHEYDVIISRSNKLSETLEDLPHDDVKFEIKGKKIIVTKR
jgi:hypothetical protein